MQIVFIHGPAAAGKFTIGARLSKTTGLSLFHNHLTVDLVAALFEFGSPSFVHLRETIWLAAFETAAAARHSFIFTFHPEATVRPGFIEQAQTIVQSNGGVIRFVELQCSDSIVEARLSHADRAAFGKLTDLDVYREIKSKDGFVFSALPEPAIRIDTSNTPPDMAAEQIKKALSL